MTHQKQHCKNIIICEATQVLGPPPTYCGNTLTSQLEKKHGICASCLARRGRE